MPLQKLQFRPGLNREGTTYSNEGGWYDGDKIRFRSGFPEKIGGWTQVSSNQFLGICRALWIWADADSTYGNTYIGVGTDVKYYIYYGGIYNDVTPIVQTDVLTNPFTTVSGSKTVTVTDINRQPSVNDYVVFSGATAVGGLTISGDYRIDSIISASQFTITAASNATSSATGGGTVTAQYEYPSGLSISIPGTGWGAGPWSRGAWGSAYNAGITQQLRLWTNDNFGADFVIAPRGGPIFYWQDLLGVSQRAQAVSQLANAATALTDASTFTSGVNVITVTAANAPYIYPYMYITGPGIPAGTFVAANYVTGSQTVQISQLTTSASSGNYSFSYAGSFAPVSTYQVIASAVQEFIIAFGSNAYIPGNPNTAFNPLLVRWSDQANPYQWIPQITNQSGEYLLTNGSFIMGARTSRQEILVWTDSCLYSMQYIGTPYVWSFQVLMDNISVISPNCMITVDNVTYWMGKDRFYMYSGVVQVLPCSLRQYIYNDINQEQAYQIFAGSNEAYNEVWWYYVSQSSNNTVVDKYVIYNYVDRVWYYGTLGRTAWMQTGIIQFPIAADYNGRLLYHEDGNDDLSTSTTLPINAYVQSSDFDIGDGHNFGFVWRILPDINFNGSSTNTPTVTMTVLPRQNSGTPYGPADNPQVQSAQNYSRVPAYTVQQFTGEVFTRLRGRQMSFRIESNDIGVAWQLGSPRIDIRPDGRR